MLQTCCYAILLSVIIFPNVVLSKGKLAVLHEDTWSEILNGEWMVDLYVYIAYIFVNIILLVPSKFRETNISMSCRKHFFCN